MRALRAMRIHIIGVQKLFVEMDAKFVKGMINNPDVQPNATINRWIAAILLFDFEIRHVPADKHTRADGLSRRPWAPEDEDPDEDFEEWVEDAMSLMYMEEWRPIVRYGAWAGGGGRMTGKCE